MNLLRIQNKVHCVTTVKMITPLGADIKPYYTVMSVQSPQWIIL